MPQVGATGIEEEEEEEEEERRKFSMFIVGIIRNTLIHSLDSTSICNIKNQVILVTTTVL
jgi:hypothetical protein